MRTEDARRGALAAIERILNRGGDPDDVLRQVVARLRELYPFVALSFVEGERLASGPSEGEPTAETAAFPVVYNGVCVGQLTVGAAERDDEPFLRRVATLASAHCLVAWDTGGERWEA